MSDYGVFDYEKIHQAIKELEEEVKDKIDKAKEEGRKQGAVEELGDVLDRLEAHKRICLTGNMRECLDLEIERIEKRLCVLKGRGDKE